jgi:hypothetical protein
MRRRTLGIAAYVLMANVTFTVTASACLMTGDGVGHAPSAADGGGTQHQHHAAPSDFGKSSTDTPTDTPSHKQPVPTCCKALAPCTSIVSAARVVTVPDLPEQGASITALGELAPESRLDAPDTPPPKA